MFSDYTDFTVFQQDVNQLQAFHQHWGGEFTLVVSQSRVYGPLLGHDIALLFGDIHIAHTWLPFSLTEPYFIVELSFVTGLEEISDEDLGKFRETSNISLTKWHKRSQNQIYTNWPREYVLVIFISFYFWQLGV